MYLYAGGMCCAALRAIISLALMLAHHIALCIRYMMDCLRAACLIQTGYTYRMPQNKHNTKLAQKHITVMAKFWAQIVENIEKIQSM